MLNEKYKDAFLLAANDWVCDAYGVDIRYIALNDGNEVHLSEAVILFNAQPSPEYLGFRLEVAGLEVGHSRILGQSKRELLEFLNEVAQGILKVHGQTYKLATALDYHSEMVFRNRWFSDLHLQVGGQRPPTALNIDYAAVENQLRNSDPPFDGIADVANWLGLAVPDANLNSPSIKIRIGPPVDVVFANCKLHDDQLDLAFHAHEKFDVSKVGVAIRVVPGSVLAARKQVASAIQWRVVEDVGQSGAATIPVEKADNVLVMLTIGETTVRRQWFLDPVKARNDRLVAMQLFDKDLKMVRQALLESQDQTRFETGVSTLLFLLGFASAVQLETDSPDLVVATPMGRIALVECTLRIADFSTKVGKLVDRRRALSKTFEASGHRSQVYGILVCGLPRDQIALRETELETHQLLLITRDELVSAFDRLRFPSDPDEMLDGIDKKFSNNLLKNV